jgi:two-component system, LytTR family, response regulator
MIKAIAIDDEENALGIIKTYGEKLPWFQLLAQFTDPIEGLKYLMEHNGIDLVFLDIQMNRLNGLDLAKSIPQSTKIVLTTAYSDYALQGFELDVADYLLKPFSFERFERSIQKVRALLHEPNQESPAQPKMKADPQDFIFVKTDYKTQKLRIMDITHIEGSGNYVTIHAGKTKYLVLQNMKTFEQQLMPYQFIRVHKSYIISLAHVDTIEKSSIKIGQEEIPLSESYKEALQQFLDSNYQQF